MELPETKLFIIHGSGGDLKVDNDGLILERPEKSYSDITKFDVEGYMRWARAQIPNDVGGLVIEGDILEFGYWYARKGFPTKYETADMDFRANVVKVYNERKKQ